MKGLVTVVVPVYNVEKYINRCLESIVNQSYKNLEIIIVDDGSPDNCPQICDEWAEKDGRIRVIHKENAGLGMARNTGLENANGEYIFFLDSDDYVDTDTISKCMKNAVENNSDLVCYGYKEVYEDGRIVPVAIRNNNPLYKDEAILNYLLPDLLMEKSGMGISVWSKMFRLDTIRNNDLKFKSEREIISEDGYFIIQLLSKVKTATVLRENFYYYIKNNSSLSRVYRDDRQQKNTVFLEKCLEYAKENSYPEIVEKAIVVCYHGYTIGAVKQILESDLDNKTKKNKLFEIYNNLVLRSTLEFGIIKYEKVTLKIFWTALKFKQYWFCKCLLHYRLKVKRK